MEIWQRECEAHQSFIGIAGNGGQTELRLYLWARGFELPWIRVKSALISEFGRLMRRRRREGLLQYDHRQRPSLSGNELSRHLKKLGELAPRLEALSFDLSPKSILDMTSRSTWGLGDQEQVPEIVHRYMPPGLLGSADEMEGSAEEQLNEANEADLENGRQLHFDLMSRLVVVPLGYALLGVPVNDPHILAFDAAAYSLMKPEWLIRNLASFTVSAYRSRTGFDEG